MPAALSKGRNDGMSVTVLAQIAVTQKRGVGQLMNAEPEKVGVRHEVLVLVKGLRR